MRYINYINKKRLGPTVEEKIEALVDDGAISIANPKEYRPNLVCVVDNGHWAAAAYCDSLLEFNRMADDDYRPKVWFIYTNASKEADK